MVWNQSPFYDGIVGLFLLIQRRRGINPIVMPPAAWGYSFYSFGGAGCFLLLCLRRRAVVTFVMPLAAWIRSFLFLW